MEPNPQPDPLPSLESSSRKNVPLKPWLLSLAACFILLLLFACRQDVDYDLGFHLRAGQWILQNHAFPSKDTFTYTVNQNDYIDLHWLYQVGIYLLYGLTGYAGLSVMNILLILTVFSLTIRRMRRTGCPDWALFFLVLPSVLCLEIRFIIRPEMVSWVLLAVTLLVLESRWNKRANFLFLLPLIQCLWANIEGLFVLGWVVMGTYVLSGLFHNRRWDRPLLKVSLLSLAASALNPYFLKGLAFPFLLLTRLDASSVFKKNISELQSPWSIIHAPDVPFFPAIPLYTYRVIAIVMLLVILFTLRRRKFHEVVLTAGFFILSATSIRNVPLFFWVVLPVAAASMTELVAGLKEKTRSLTDFFASMKLIPWVILLAVLLLCARVGTQAYYVSDRRVDHNGFGVDAERFPFKALDFMERNHLKGPLLNDPAFGGWIEWRTGMPVFIDGRQEVIQEALFTEYEGSYAAGGLSRLADKYGVKLILYDHMMGIPWTMQLQRMPGWRLIYLDDVAALYAAKDAAPSLPEIYPKDVLPLWGIQPGPSSQDFPEFHRHSLNDWLAGFFQPQTYPMPLMRLGSFAYEINDYEAAKVFFLEALRRSQGKYYEIYYNLASAYTRLGLKDQAKTCYEKILELEPGNAQAQAKLAQL